MLLHDTCHIKISLRIGRDDRSDGWLFCGQLVDNLWTTLWITLLTSSEGKGIE